MYTWTPEMGKIAKRANLEDHTRDAVSAACKFLDGVTLGEVPRWNGNASIRTPGNKNASLMLEAIMAAIKSRKPELSGSDREAVIAAAVNAAFIVRAGGSGDAGWKVLANAISKRTKFNQIVPVVIKSEPM